MRKLTLILISLFTILLFSFVASAAPLTITYTGSLTHTTGTDAQGIDGATFVWQGVFDSLATPYSTNHSSIDRFSGDISIELTIGSKVVSLTPPSVPVLNTIAESNGGLSGGGIGRLQLSNASHFELGASILTVGEILLNDPDFLGDITSPTNTLTPVNTADASAFLPFTVIDADPLSFTVDEYAVENGAIVTVVPEPSTALLMGLGLAGLASRRR